MHIQTVPSLNKLTANLRVFIVIIAVARYLSDFPVANFSIAIAILCSSQCTQHSFSLLKRENGFVSF